MAGASSPPLPPDGPWPRGDRAQRARRLRLRITAGAVALLAVSWNVVAVLGRDSNSHPLASPSAGNPLGGSIDVTAPVTSRQS